MWLESFFSYEITMEKIPLEEDDFLKLANEYYKSDIFKKVISYNTLEEEFGHNVLRFPSKLSDWSLNTPTQDILLLKGVFHYITNENYRLGEIIPGYRRYSHVVKYEEINDVNAVMNFFSEKNVVKNREEFINRLRKKTFSYTNFFENFD